MNCDEERATHSPAAICVAIASTQKWLLLMTNILLSCGSGAPIDSASTLDPWDCDAVAS